MSIKKYKRESDYSYTLGIFPTIEILQQKPNLVDLVYYNQKCENSDGFKTIYNLCEQNKIPLLLNNHAVERLAVRDNTYTVGIFKKENTQIKFDENHIVLYEPSDIGNLGTIFRSGLGFGFYNYAIIGNSVDIFNPLVVRASMGAYFHINIERFATFADYKARLSTNQSTYIFDIKATNNIQNTEFKKPFSLIFGSEGNGMPDELLYGMNLVKIDHSAEIESLNLANSISIAAFWSTLNNI